MTVPGAITAGVEERQCGHIRGIPMWSVTSFLWKFSQVIGATLHNFWVQRVVAQELLSYSSMQKVNLTSSGALRGTLFWGNPRMGETKQTKLARVLQIQSGHHQSNIACKAVTRWAKGPRERLNPCAILSRARGRLLGMARMISLHHLLDLSCHPWG